MTTPFQQHLIAVAARKDAGTACPDCKGYGEKSQDLPGDAYRFVPCSTCEGTGTQPVPAVHLAENCPCLIDESGVVLVPCTAHEDEDQDEGPSATDLTDARGEEENDRRREMPL